MAAATASKIPEVLRGEVLTRAGEGEGSEQIAAWLLAEHQVRITGRSVRSFLAARREERSEITKDRLAAKLDKTITADLDRVDQLLGDAKAVQDHAWGHGKLEDGEPRFDGELALKAMEQQRKLLELRFKLSGAGGPEQQPLGVVILPAEQD
jgi:hypothetical protein